MKLIKPSFEIISQEDLFQHIEKCGRVAYKSEDKITPDSAEKFVNMLIKSGHYSPLEHGTVILFLPPNHVNVKYLFHKYITNPYSKVIYIKDAMDNPILDEAPLYVITNYRCFSENPSHWGTDLSFTTDSKALEHLKDRRITVKFILSRAAAQQFTRHRKFSFTMESQRYCNYNKDKFGNEITFIMPQWYENTKYYDYHLLKEFEEALASIEKLYMFYISKGLKPQEARAILPNATKTELVMTGFIEDWQHFFNERCSFLAKTGKPDDEAAYLADGLYEEFKKRNLL
jgi:thymidylate synthase (FAD)